MEIQENMYKFNLEILRKYRKRQEEEVQKELAEWQRKLNKEENRLKDLENIKNDICIKKEKMQKLDFKANENILFYKYIKNLEDQISSQNYLVKKTKIDYKAKYDELIRAVKKRKIMETLKERGEKIYVDESKYREQKGLDEIGILGFQRKNTEHAL